MSLLRKIIDNKRIEIELRKKMNPESSFSEMMTKSTRNFHNALSGNGLTIIAEMKKRSPSSGVLSNNFNPARLAQNYERGGAGAISVLTDEKFFGGQNQFISDVKNATSLPVLRKDFIIDPYQISESKFLGADAILLIARILDQKILAALVRSAEKYRIDCLVEVHSREEINTVLKSGAVIIGVNNRDLDTLMIDLSKSLRLKKYIPAGITTVSESGIKNRADIELMIDAGFDAVLMGTVLMGADNVVGCLKELTGRRNE